MIKIPTSAQVLLYEDKFQKFQEPSKNIFLGKDEVLQRNLKKQFTKIERDIAQQNHRSPGTIKVEKGVQYIEQHMRRNYNAQSPENTTPLASYDPANNQYTIRVIPGKTGMHLLSSFYHEAEHATQAYGDTYNQEQKQLLAISAMFYPRHKKNETHEEARQIDVDYRNNYQELYAHIAEAQLFIAAYHELLNNYPQQLIQTDTILMFDDIVKRLLTDVSQENALEMNAYHIQALQQGYGDTEFLQDTFHLDAENARAAAIEFLQTIAPELYNAAIKRAQEVGRELSRMLKEMQIENQAAKSSALFARHDPMRQAVQQYAQKFNIPILLQQPAAMVFGQITITDGTLKDFLLEPKMPQFSRVIIMEDGKEPVLMFDYHPIPRPYSTDPILKAQWEQEHQSDITGDELDEQNLDDEPR